MITRIEAFRCRRLPEVSQELSSYQISVGPNGSGKSAFLNVITFLSDLVSRGLKEAVSERTEMTTTGRYLHATHTSTLRRKRRIQA